MLTSGNQDNLEAFVWGAQGKSSGLDHPDIKVEFCIWLFLGTREKILAATETPCDSAEGLN